MGIAAVDFLQDGCPLLDRIHLNRDAGLGMG